MIFQSSAKSPSKMRFGRALLFRDTVAFRIKQIVNDKTDLNQFNQKEHAGLCCAGEAFIGAYLVCNYAQ